MFITDRSQADVDRVAFLRRIGFDNMTESQQAEWLSPMKGAYNYTDMNRVESAVAHVASQVGLPLVTKTDWTASDVPTRSDMQRYLDNVKAIVSVLQLPFAHYIGGADGFDYEAANNVEKNVHNCEKTAGSIKHLGEIYCGEW